MEVVRDVRWLRGRLAAPVRRRATVSATLPGRVAHVTTRSLSSSRPASSIAERATAAANRA